MLRKLIKYDLKWSLKIVSVYYIIGFITAVIGRLFDFLPDSTFFNVVGGFIKGASISLTIAGIINCIIRTWVRMIMNMYKDESYLTHTIPTSRRNHFYSKVITSIIVLTVSFIVLLINVLILYLSNNSIDFIKNLMNTFENLYDGSTTVFIILVFMLLLVEIIYIVLCGFFAIIYGYSFENGKLGKSFLIGFIGYGILNTVSLFIILFSTIFSSDLYHLIFKQAELTDFNFFLVLLVISLILYLIYSALLFVLSCRKLDKGVNIE